jgi:Ran GTPase-activating protein (RanGAP) involved in mRNA processing and transport
MGNRIGKEMLSKLQEIMRSKPNLISLCGIADDTTEVDLSGLGMDADDAIVLASELPDKRALTSLNLASNSLVSKSEWIKKANVKVGKILDGNPVVEVHSNATHIKVLQIGGMRAIANAIRDMRALSSANLLRNSIPVEQAQELVKTMRAKKNLTTLCGLSGEETELDFSGQDLGAGDAVLIANDISDMVGLVHPVQVGTAIEAQYRGWASWCKGQVVELGQECYTVKYTDGTRETNVPFYLTRLVERTKGALRKFGIRNSSLCAAGANALAEGIRGNPVMTELNLAGSKMGKESGKWNAEADMSGIIALAGIIPGMRAISSVNLLKNNIGIDQAKNLVSILKEHPTLKTICGIKGNATALDMSGKMDGAGDAIMLVAEIVGNGALTALNLAGNSLGKMVPPEGWSYGFHGDYSGGQLYKHTDGRKMQNGKPEGTTSGAIVIAAVIPDMGALSSANLLRNSIPVEQAQELVKIMRYHMRAKENLTTLCGLSREETELDFSRQNLGAGDAVLIANDISDMGAISSVNILGNSIGVEQAQELIKILHNKEKLTTLCGFSGDEIDLNLSKKKLSAGCGVLVANEISDMRALSVLYLASNNLGELVPPNGWSIRDQGYNFQKYIHVNGREQKEDPGSKPEGVTALANAIPDMGAMTKLDISYNNLYLAGCKALTEALSGNKTLVELAVAGNKLGMNWGASSDNPDLSGVIALANVVPGMQVLNLSSNALGSSGITALCAAIRFGLYKYQ